MGLKNRLLYGKSVQIRSNGQYNLARKFEITRRDFLLDSVLVVASVSKRVFAQNHLYENVFSRFIFMKMDFLKRSLEGQGNLKMVY